MLSQFSRATGVVLVGFALASAAASAQQPYPPAAPAGAAKTAAPATPSVGAAKSKSAAKPGESGQSSTGGSEGGVAKRLDQLEEQVVDMQVVIGTLESLAKSGAATSPASVARVSPGGGGLSSGDAARLDGIETQIRALTAQVEQLAEQLRAQGQRRSEALPPPRAPAPTASAAAVDFGSTSVSAGDGGGDPIGGLLAGSKTAAAGAAAGAGYSSATLPPVTGAGSAPAGDGGDQNPKQLYETAYGYLLQQDYGAAETAFDDFLKRYPSDSLSGNAQYWLGESFYVRGQYKQAASAFLKGYQTYGKSAKAPDSLLKLAMSLDKLGQKDAACSSYGELGTRFPTAAPHIKGRAQSERQRLGCS